MSTQDVSQALGGAIDVHKLSMEDRELRRQAARQTATDITEKAYKEALTAESRARAKKMMMPEAADPLDKSFMGGYTLRQYKALPTNEREYLVHVKAAKASGETPMSREEFNAIDEKDKHPTTAMAAALDQLYIEHNGKPPESEIKRIFDLFQDEPQEKTPTPMNWNQAIGNLEQRFGSFDVTGRWAVTPGLQLAHTKAQERLNVFREQGLHPQDATNRAEEYGRKYQNAVEDNYFEQIKNADEDEIVDINAAFYEQYGYKPSRSY